jgi:hypothetical protein
MADEWIKKQLEKQNTVLNDKELAKALDPTGKIVTAWVIRNWRLQGGLPYFAVGKRIFFRLESVLAWMDAREAGGGTVVQEPITGTLRVVK